MKDSPVLVAVLALFVTFATVFVSPIYVFESTTDNVLRGWPLAWLSYTSLSPWSPLFGGLDFLTFSLTWNFSVVGFVLDFLFWFGVVYVLTFAARRASEA